MRSKDEGNEEEKDEGNEEEKDEENEENADEMDRYDSFLILVTRHGSVFAKHERCSKPGYAKK